MVRALADGDNRHRLENADGRDIGWIAQRTIGFRGFPTERDAVSAAVDSWHALEGALNREYAGRPRTQIAADRVRVVRDGSGECVSDGTTVLARLRRLPDDAPSGSSVATDASSGSSLAIELQLPTYATEGVAIAAAQVLARAIHRHLESGQAAPLAEGVA